MSDTATTDAQTPQAVVDYDLDDEVATITLNRPHRLNAVNTALVEGLCQALETATAARPGAIILRGRGRAFCAGHDLTEDLLDAPEPALRARVQRMQDVTRLMRAAPAPVVASVHGYALGAGCEFALCSDLIIAAADAQFGFPEVGVGLTVTGGISHVLPLAVGLARAKELLLLGERLSAERALSLGLVNRVVAAAELEDATRDLAARLAAQPRTAALLAKQVLDRGAAGTVDAALELEADHALVAMRGADAAAAAAAFRAGRRQAHG